MGTLATARRFGPTGGRCPEQLTARRLMDPNTVEHTDGTFYHASRTREVGGGSGVLAL